MAVKTFTTGEVLTASDTNTYLANGGLVYITQASITGQNALAINSCFNNATYENYRVVLYASGASSPFSLFLKLRLNGANSDVSYYTNMRRTPYTGAAADDQNANVAQFIGGAVGAGPSFAVWDIIRPNAAVNTTISINAFGTGPAFATSYVGGGVHDVATAYDGFSVSITAGNNWSGKAVVYGYRIS